MIERSDRFWRIRKAIGGLNFGYCGVCIFLTGLYTEFCLWLPGLSSILRLLSTLSSSQLIPDHIGILGMWRRQYEPLDTLYGM